MDRTKRPPRYTYRQRNGAKSYASRKQIDVDGEREIVPRKLLVFAEGELVVLSIIRQHGTVNFQMSRDSVANLLGHLGRCLAPVRGMKQRSPGFMTARPFRLPRIYEGRLRVILVTVSRRNFFGCRPSRQTR